MWSWPTSVRERRSVVVCVGRSEEGEGWLGEWRCGLRRVFLLRTGLVRVWEGTDFAEDEWKQHEEGEDWKKEGVEDASPESLVGVSAFVRLER